VAEAVSMIEDSADEDAHIIFGYVSLEEPCEEVKVTVIATGFNHAEQQPAQAGRHSAQTGQRGFYTGSRPGTERSSRPKVTSSIAPPRTTDVTEQVQIPAGRSSGIRASSTSDSDLDIPAFIRRQSE
jgi:cell division protein FtsZ